MMDKELEELESLFSEHFGRTPTASQASEVDMCMVEDDESDTESHTTEEITSTEDLDARVQSFLQETAHVVDDEDCEEGTDVDTDPQIDTIRGFISAGCGCKRNCTELFTEAEAYTHILNINEMERADQEMYIMATLSTSTDNECTKRGKKRQRQSHDFCFKGTRICKRTFMLLFDVGKHSLQSLLTHVIDNGVTPTTHKNTGRKPSKALKFPDIRNVVQFITNYADELGLPQPAAPRGRDDTAPIYLTSDTTKAQVHNIYVTSCTESDLPSRAVKYSTFNNIWRSCLSHIKIATARDDVCATCEKLRKKVQDAVLEEEKLDCANNLRDHVLTAQKERTLYNECIKRSLESYSSDEAENYVHYTFDFCQNVSLPHHSRQMGPMYFATLRKVQIFGFRVDGVPNQLNFHVDENETIGPDGKCTHGPNSVISMIHWAMETHISGETSCTIHADNCPGQNKNKYVIGYMMWRVMTGRHEKIEYCMQIPGHARCLVDSGFACLKKLYRRFDCEPLASCKTWLINRLRPTQQCDTQPGSGWIGRRS